MAYLVYNPTTRLITSAYRTSTEANTAAALETFLASDTTDRSLPTFFTPNEWYFTIGSDIIPSQPTGDAANVIVRRETHRQLLQGLEKVDGLASWFAGGDDSNRARIYSRWVEMQAMAGSIDSNLSDNQKWGWLLAEASIPGRVWYVLFELGNMDSNAKWLSWLNDNTRSNWTFYNTASGGITPGTRGGISRGGISLSVADGFNWVFYLGGLL